MVKRIVTFTLERRPPFTRIYSSPNLFGFYLSGTHKGHVYQSIVPLAKLLLYRNHSVIAETLDVINLPELTETGRTSLSFYDAVAEKGVNPSALAITPGPAIKGSLRKFPHLQGQHVFYPLGVPEDTELLNTIQAIIDGRLATIH